MLKNFFEGISSYADAIRHISKYGLWGYVFLPGLLSVVLAAAIVFLAWNLSDNVGGLLDDLWVWETGKSIAHKISQILGGILILLFSLLVFKQLLMVISSPFLSLLSEKVENQLVGRVDSSSMNWGNVLSDLIRGLRIAGRNTFRELGGTALLLLLGLIPIFPPVSVILIFILQSYYAGFSNLDFALERHYAYHDSIKFVQSNRMLAIGNGAVFMFLLYSFVGLLVALPLGTVAATIAATKRVKGNL